MAEADPATPEQRIWQVVAQIPKGKVASYGQVAQLAGLGRGARMVGRTLHKLPAGSRLPWHRVINAQGRISLPEHSHSYQQQRQRLEDEGVRFNPGGKTDLELFGWRP